MNPLSLAQKVFLLMAGLSGAASVMLGALGAHYLKDILNYWERQSFETGARYQMYHALALIALVILMNYMPSKWLNWAGYLFCAGIVLFSGSLYLIALDDVFGILYVDLLGPVTPIGGIAFILGWLFLGVAVITKWKL